MTATTATRQHEGQSAVKAPASPSGFAKLSSHRKPFSLRTLIVVGASLFCGSSALGQEPPQAADAHSIAPLTRSDSAVFFFGGPLHSGDWNTSFDVLGAPYEGNFVLGGGAQKFLFDLPLDVRLGVEGGAVMRFGESTSVEGWGGLVARYDGLVISDTFRVSPSITWGLSLESDSIGSQTVRAAQANQSSRVLFYLSPEVSIGRTDSDVEFFWRIQHRSGGYCFIACINGTNANTLGVRFKF